MNLVPQHFWQRLAGVGVLCLGLLSGPTTTAAPSITAWGSATMATKTDGSLLSWGIQCCARSQGSETPVQLASGVDRAFTAYSNLSLLKANGELYIWGNNFANQLLNPSLSRSSTPVLVGTDYVDVVANLSVIAVKRDGSLWAWGDNSYGQLGVGTRDKVTQPTQIGSGFAKLANQGYDFDFTYAIKTDGSLWGWGRSNSAGGRLGDGTSRDILLPERIMGDVASVAVGRYHTVAIKTDGSLWAWGNGPLGDGGFDRSDIPKRIGEGFVTAAAGQLFTLAIKTDGTLWAWGANDYGQLGDGTVTDQLSPILSPKMIGSGYARVAAGDYHGVAIKTDGSLWTWGLNSGYQLGFGAECCEPYPNAPLLKGSLKPRQLFASGFAITEPLTVSVAQSQVQSPQLITAQLKISNDTDQTVTYTPFVMEAEGVQHAPDPEDAAKTREEPASAGKVKVLLANVTLAPRSNQTLDVPLQIARPDLTSGATASMAVEFGATTPDNQSLRAVLSLSVSPRSEPAGASAFMTRLSTGPVADMGANAGISRLGPRTISTDLPSADGDYWNLWVLTEMEKRPKGDEDRKFLFKLTRLGLSPREAYAVLYLRAITQLKPERAGRTQLFKLAKGGAELWLQLQKSKLGLTPDFAQPAKTILEGLDSVNALYFLNVLSLNPSYAAPLVNAITDNFAAFTSTYARTSQALCTYMENGTLLSLPFPRLVEADLAHYMTSNGRWHPKIHNVVFGGVTVRGKDGQAQSLSRFLEIFMADYANRDVPGCSYDAQRHWVRIQVHSPLMPMVTDAQGRRFGVAADGRLVDEIAQAYIDPGHPWTLAIPAVEGALTVDYTTAYPYNFGIELQGVYAGTTTSEHVTRGAAVLGSQLRQSATLARTPTGVTLTVGNSTVSTVQSRADRVFNWAEKSLVSFFPPGAVPLAVAGYFARHYPAVNAYLAVNTTTDELLYLGPASGGALLNLGALSGWLDQASAAGF